MPENLNRSFKGGENTSFPYVVLVVSLILTIGVTYLFYKSAKNKDLLRFNNEVNRVHLAIENKINLCLALLKGGRGFVESSAELNRKKFSNYVQSLELDKNYVGVQGIGYSKIVLPNERDDLIKKMKSEGYADFKIFPEGERDSYQAIIYLEPLDERNKKVIGFDMSTENNRRSALERARDSGEASVTSKVVLLQENESNKQFGFLLYLPIYKNGELPPTPEERKQDLQGYIYSPFRAGDFLNKIQANASAYDIEISIFDGEPIPVNLLAGTNVKIEQPLINQNSDTYTKQEEFDFGGRKWNIKYNAMPSFAEQSSISWSPLIFLSGSIFSFLLFGMTYWESSARADLQVAAAELFESEKQKQILLENEQKARVLAEQANKTKDEFIAVVSHELRTPLNAIAGWTQILKTESLSTKTKDMALVKIEKNLRSQTDLVEELLDYSQIIAGNSGIEDIKIDFSKVFESTFLSLEAKAHEKGIKFIKDNKLTNRCILGNEDKIKLVIYNLLSNAIKFTPNGGKVEAFASIEGEYIQMIVKDNGRGIIPDYLPHIFDRFQQADNSMTRSHGGLGLGLAISHQIVKLHKGMIEAKSEGISKGSTFTVKFPFV